MYLSITYPPTHLGTHLILPRPVQPPRWKLSANDDGTGPTVWAWPQAAAHAPGLCPRDLELCSPGAGEGPSGWVQDSQRVSRISRRAPLRWEVCRPARTLRIPVWMSDWWGGAWRRREDPRCPRLPALLWLRPVPTGIALWRDHLCV